MNIILFFFLSIINLSYSKELRVYTEFNNTKVKGAEVSIKSLDREFSEELSGVTNSDGKAIFDTSSDRVLIKAKANGFRNKGFIGSIKDEDYIVLEMSPFIGSFSGRVLADGKFVKGQKVYIKNLFTGELFSTRSSEKGLFTFKKLPVNQDHLLVIVPDNREFCIYYEEINLRDSTDLNQDISLLRDEYFILIRTSDIEYRDVVINNILVDLDENGMGKLVLNNLPDNKLEIFYKGDKIVKEIKFEGYIDREEESIEDTIYRILNNKSSDQIRKIIVNLE